MTSTAAVVRDVEALLIDGTRVQAENDAVFDVLDPSSGECVARVARASAGDVARAVSSAARAFASTWSQTPAANRSQILHRISRRIAERAAELATLETIDVGKPLRQSRHDVVVAARYFEFYAGAADKIFGETIPLGPEYVDFTVREPIGVSAQIVPWNYPLQLSSRGIAPALAAGCTVVAKPSTLAPLTTLRIAEIALECGLPAGVLNVVPGTGPEAGAALASNPEVAQITFTGSVDVGIEIARTAALNVVPTTLELGGKSPNIVFADCDLDVAAATVQRAIFQNSGQTCSAGSRLLVESSVRNEFLDRLVERVRAMRVGPGIDDSDMGPLISRERVETVDRIVAQAVGHGARTVVGGGRSTDVALSGGFFFEPTILEAADPNMNIVREEVFGPVLSVVTFDRIGEAAALANSVGYGLVAGIWTRDIDKALWLAGRIRAGQVFINAYFAGTGVELPFGGYNKSGYGREKGMEALRGYTQLKNICVRIHSDDQSVAGAR